MNTYGNACSAASGVPPSIPVNAGGFVKLASGSATLQNTMPIAMPEVSAMENHAQKDISGFASLPPSLMLPYLLKPAHKQKISKANVLMA